MMYKIGYLKFIAIVALTVSYTAYLHVIFSGTVIERSVYRYIRPELNEALPLGGDPAETLIISEGLEVTITRAVRYRNYFFVLDVPVGRAEIDFGMQSDIFYNSMGLGMYLSVAYELYMYGSYKKTEADINENSGENEVNGHI